MFPIKIKGKAEKVFKLCLKKKIKLPKDVAQGYKVWQFCCNYDPETRLTPDYAFKIVNKSDGHPVRLGEQSIRFEVRRGDCGVSPGGYDDCAIKNPEIGMTSERHELSLDPEVSPFKKVTWNTYSIFLPEDFPLYGFDHITMGQLHGDGDGAVGFQWDIGVGGGYVVNRRTGCFLPKNKNKKCSISNPENNTQQVIPKDKLLGKWHDIVFNIKWTKKQTGYLKQWINGQLVYHYQGNTDTPREKEQFQMGIYRGPLPSTPKNLTQIAYFDQVRFAKSCKKLKLKDLGYSCNELESQKISKIDTIEKDISNLVKKYPHNLRLRLLYEQINNNQLQEIISIFKQYFKNINPFWKGTYIKTSIPIHNDRLNLYFFTIQIVYMSPFYFFI